MTFKELIYGNDYLFLSFLDDFFVLFEHSDFVNNERLNRGDILSNFDSVIEQLEADRMIKINEYGINITLKGKSIIKKGGYKRLALMKRLVAITIIIGTITSILGIFL